MSTDLHDYLDRTLADLEVPTDRLRTGAVSRGRVVRRRRRVVGALGASALAVIGAVLVVPSVAGSDGAADRVAHDTTPDPTFYEPPAGWWDMPGPVMRDRLARMLPEDAVIVESNLGNEDRALGEDPSGGWLQVDVASAGEPAGGLNVVLYAPQPDGTGFVEERTTCPGNLEGPDACTLLRDPDGKVVGRAARWAQGAVVVLEVTHLLPDGGLVYTGASNSSDDKWGAESSTDRTLPAVTAAELREIAADPAWQDWTPRS